ncbi:hypothetical protein V6N13_142974 [Hibiscus sabdariffa]|uniref:Uncharacterized protein n=1 Tax=Hibiscus sabdariffa TaxID=183260 RepID=A0ABR2FGE8_9ROSI
MGVICLRIVVNWSLQLVVRILRRKRKTMVSMGMMAVMRRSDLKVSSERRGNSEISVSRIRKSRKGVVGSEGFGLLGTQVLELRDWVVRREEKRKEREFVREKDEMEGEGAKEEGIGVWERKAME